MCQAEVLKVLENENRWFTAKEIAEKLGLSNVVNVNLNKLVKQDLVERCDAYKTMNAKGRVVLWKVKD